MTTSSLVSAAQDFSLVNAARSHKIEANDEKRAQKLNALADTMRRAMQRIEIAASRQAALTKGEFYNEAMKLSKTLDAQCAAAIAYKRKQREENEKERAEALKEHVA